MSDPVGEESTGEVEPEEEDSEPEETPAPDTLRRASTRVVWKYRLRKHKRWFPPTRTTPEGTMCWTETQMAFYRAFATQGINMFSHRVIQVDTLARAAGMTLEEFLPYIRYLPGLEQILMCPGHYHHEWVRIFISTVWIDPEHRYIEYMFNGNRFRVGRQALANIFGARAEGDRIHQLAYPGVDPPRRAYSSNIHAPDHETAAAIYRPPFGPASERHPSALTPLAYTLLDALCRSLLSRTGNRETVTAL
jgi:hypothetical protein